MKKIMSKYISGFLITAFVLVSGFVLSFSPIAVAADTLKIGGVSLQAIIDNSKAGKVALDKIKKRMEKETAVMKRKQGALKKLARELEQKRLILRESVLEQKSLELNRMQRDLELYRGDIKATLQRAQAKEMRRLMNDILTIIKEYAAKNGYSMVLESGQGANLIGSNVIYLEDSLDLTATITRIYDEQYTKTKEAGGKIKPGK